MRNQNLVCVGVVLFMSICHVAMGDQPKLLEGPGPYDWECKSDGASINEVEGPTMSEHLKVSGVMHVTNMHVNRFDQSGATAAVGFNDGKLMQSQSVAFQLLVMQSKQDTIKIAIRGDGGSQATHTLASQPNTESVIPFILKLDHGIVTVVAASSALNSPDGHPVKIEAASKKPQPDLKQMFLSCSGAQIKFSNVTVSSDPN